MQSDRVPEFVKRDAVIVTTLSEGDAVATGVANARVAADAGEKGDGVVVTGRLMGGASSRGENDAGFFHPFFHRPVQIFNSSLVFFELARHLPRNDPLGPKMLFVNNSASSKNAVGAV